MKIMGVNRYDNFMMGLYLLLTFDLKREDGIPYDPSISVEHLVQMAHF